MTTLIIFYSRTGTTKKVAELISESLTCDIEEIFDEKNRSGTIGYAKAGKDAMRKKLTTLKQYSKDPSSYDLTIIGTPIWAFNMSTPIRTYITENKDKFKKVAFFCTEGNKGGEKCFENMTELCEKQPVAMLELTAKEIKNDLHLAKIKEYTDKLI
jgi:flavodoxin